MRFYVVVLSFLSLLAALSAVFYGLMVRDVGQVDFSLVSASFNASAKDYSINAPGKPLVMHFIDNSCRCNRFSKPHIERLKTRLANNAIHVMLEKSDTKADAFASTPLLEVIPATPAVAIFDATGKLRYFGPYSNGDVCGEGKDMVVYTLNELKKDSSITWLSQEYVGCVCPWQGV